MQVLMVLPIPNNSKQFQPVSHGSLIWRIAVSPCVNAIRCGRFDCPCRYWGSSCGAFARAVSPGSPPSNASHTKRALTEKGHGLIRIKHHIKLWGLFVSFFYKAEVLENYIFWIWFACLARLCFC